MMKTPLAEKLAENKVFASLTESDLAQLAQLSIPRNYDEDEWMVLYGEVWPYLLWMEDGLITALKESPAGRSLIVVTIKPGEIFWGTAFFNDDASMPVALIADRASRMHLWSREKLLPILLRNGKMSWELSRLMVKFMQRASDIVEELAFQPITGRLARLLLDRYSGSNDSPVARDLTLDEMAAHIGSTREMVCRALYRFSDDGLIEITRTEFLFTDQEKLEKLAQKGKR
ncbi:MAG: Crp/Fnr family transcriptional regulator [Anaerolineales bacterium]|nr:Crp/Fnr family transcriptional regulator [Anaerolineales bacterium]